MKSNGSSLHETQDVRQSERWLNVWKNRNRVAEMLNKTAPDLPPREREQLHSLGRWLESTDSVESMFVRPDALETLLPLFLQGGEIQPAEDSKMNQAVLQSLWSPSRNYVGNENYVGLLYGPLLVTIGCLILTVFGCIFVVPPFESLLKEFGIEYPLLTRAFFGFAHFIQQSWCALLAVPMLIVVVIFCLDRKGKDNRPVNLSFLDEKLMRTRSALAGWAWHVSLLLKAGQQKEQALETAMVAIRKQGLRRALNDRLAQADFGAVKDNLTGDQVFGDWGFPMLDFALQQSGMASQIAFLQETARYYWDQDRNTGRWWISWLGAAIMWFFGAILALGVVALFLPMFAVIRGLYYPW